MRSNFLLIALLVVPIFAVATCPYDENCLNKQNEFVNSEVVF